METYQSRATSLQNEQLLQVPYGCTVHGEEEIEAVIKVLKTSTQMGRNVREMEAKVSEIFAKKFGVMVNSGSSANYLAFEILGLPYGSEVITPALTFSTTVGPIIKNGLIPTFIDVEENTFNIDANQIEQMITPATKAMMIPNLLGNLPNWKKLRELAENYHLILIEDSADTLGATLDDLPVSRYSDLTTTSFYGSHVINCAGNGGMLCVNSEKLCEEAQLLRSWGRSSSLYVESEAIENRFNVEVNGIGYDAKFVFDKIGYNFEPSEMGAAFGLVQLKKLSNNIDLRVKHFNQQLNFFSKFEEWFILPKQADNTKTGWLAFPLIVRDTAPFKRTELQIFFEKNKIQTRTVFTGNILRQPGFQRIRRKESTNGYPNADQVMRGGLLLGCHHGMTNEMMNYVHRKFIEFANNFS